MRPLNIDDIEFMIVFESDRIPDFHEEGLPSVAGKIVMLDEKQVGIVASLLNSMGSLSESGKYIGLPQRVLEIKLREKETIRILYHNQLCPEFGLYTKTSKGWFYSYTLSQMLRIFEQGLRLRFTRFTVDESKSKNLIDTMAMRVSYSRPITRFDKGGYSYTPRIKIVGKEIIVEIFVGISTPEMKNTVDYGNGNTYLNDKKSKIYNMSLLSGELSNDGFATIFDEPNGEKLIIHCEAGE